MSYPILLKINVTRIIKEHMFKGEKGVYLDCACFENKTGPDEKGYTHFICQSVSKEARDRGERGPIIGNLKMPNGQSQQRKPAPSATSNDGPPDDSGTPPF